MAKNSEYQKHKLQEQKKKLKELESGLPRYIRDYLGTKELSVQPSSVTAYAHDLGVFMKFLLQNNPACRDIEPKDVPLEILSMLEPQDINEYQRWLSYSDACTNKERGIARRMVSLRGLFKFLVMNRYLERDPTVGAVRYRKPPKDDIVRMDGHEVSRMLDMVKSSSISSPRQRRFCEKSKLRDTAIVTLLLGTGIRVSECVGLDLDDLDLEAGTMAIVRKGGKTQSLYLGPDVIQALQDYIDTERKAFIGDDKEPALFLSNRKTRMCARSVENLVGKYARESVPGKHITPHKLRSTYGTALYQATGDIRLVADVLGHEDINTTAKYYAAIEESHRKIAAQTKLYG